MAGEVALDGRGGMISGTKAKLTPLCRRNRRLRPQKNPHYSGMGWVWSLNLRIQGFDKPYEGHSERICFQEYPMIPDKHG
jgi:hypothetical protein